VPYFDLTISAVKSVSVLHASYRVSAGRQGNAAARVSSPSSSAKRERRRQAHQAIPNTP
jgi:hypothetical protein